MTSAGRTPIVHGQSKGEEPFCMTVMHEEKRCCWAMQLREGEKNHRASREEKTVGPRLGLPVVQCFLDLFGPNDEGPMGLRSMVIECKIRKNIKIKIRVKKEIRTR